MEPQATRVALGHVIPMPGTTQPGSPSSISIFAQHLFGNKATAWTEWREALPKPASLGALSPHSEVRNNFAESQMHMVHSGKPKPAGCWTSLWRRQGGSEVLSCYVGERGLLPTSNCLTTYNSRKCTFMFLHIPWNRSVPKPYISSSYRLNPEGSESSHI